METRYLSMAEAAIYTGVDERTLRRYIARRELRAYRIGPRLLKFDRVDLDGLFRVAGVEGRG
ncbi:helix-turn-helix transcriptional regulator [Nocardia acidivorans]|uniref:helix-turn-helix transcriptional regulator n=1 Tax=Nocardia acidivorans TaxID=404580 RepID=UPI0008339B77|nr:helix-turn-helix domain-containing protein [Nocardia acidivorans]